jgi:hypothetical protein
MFKLTACVRVCAAEIFQIDRVSFAAFVRAEKLKIDPAFVYAWLLLAIWRNF